MKSNARFRIPCLLCRTSSDWCAKEKECKDSDGNLDKSSVKLSADEEVESVPGARAGGNPSVIEEDLGGRA